MGTGTFPPPEHRFAIEARATRIATTSKPSSTEQRPVVVVAASAAVEIHDNPQDPANPIARARAGGLATGFSGQNIDAWFGVPRGELDREFAVRGTTVRTRSGAQAGFIPLDPALADAQRTFANRVLWLLHHNMLDEPEPDGPGITANEMRELWPGYVAANREIARHLIEWIQLQQVTGVEPVVLVQDYQVALVPHFIEELAPDLEVSIAYFQHIPHASAQQLGAPWLPREVIDELVAMSPRVAAFHDEMWAHNRDDVLERFGIDAPPAFVTPFHPDATSTLRAYHSEEAQAFRETILERAAGRRIIAFNGRVDPTKCLVDGVLAFTELLRNHPELRGSVVLELQAPGSRSEPEYVYVADQLDQAVEALRKEFGDSVIHVATGEELSFEHSLALSSAADVVLVLDHPNGQNFITTEAGLVNTESCVAVMTPYHGSASRIGAIALLVHPHEIGEITERLHDALTMNDAERRTRFALFKEEAERFTTQESFLGASVTIATSTESELWRLARRYNGARDFPALRLNDALRPAR